MKKLTTFIGLSVILLSFISASEAQFIVNTQRLGVGALHAFDANNRDIGPVLDLGNSGVPLNWNALIWLDEFKGLARINFNTGRMPQVKTKWTDINCTGQGYVFLSKVGTIHSLSEDHNGNTFQVSPNQISVSTSYALEIGGCVAENDNGTFNPITYVTVPHYPFVVPIALDVR